MCELVQMDTYQLVTVDKVRMLIHEMWAVAHHVPFLFYLQNVLYVLTKYAYSMHTN